MRKFIGFIVLAVLLLVPMIVQAQDDSSDVSVTVYNQGTALIQDRRTFTLNAGVNTLNFSDVAAGIDPTSVSFKSLTDPAGTRVLEQNYVYDLVDSSALLNKYLDEIIVVTMEDGTVFSGQLLSGRGGEIILRSDSGQVTVVGLSKIRDIQFPQLPDGLITRPTLRWLINSSAAGEQQVELTYLTGGLNWSADYILLLTTDNRSLDLNGWVTLNNTSGAAFRDAQLKLVAGDVNRLPVDQELRFGFEEGARAADGIALPDVAQREFSEYQLYEVGRPVTIADNETKQIEFVTASGVPAKTFFVYESSPLAYGYYYFNEDQYYGQTGITTVQNWIEFSTGEEAGVGADLPAGRVRVYQEDVDGAALLIGENSINHTPQGEDVRFFLGNAFDLVGERIQTDFNLISGRVLEESYELHLRNRKDDDTVEIRVPEHLFRWSNWEILSSSHPYTKLDSSTIEFRVMVEPGAEVIITYRVRYSWPS